ncbi:MAG TPA: glutamate racemase [Candidatus Ozemobacteraceae bacterium]|nr:glutamate racemase [Candidatus Ozemobacteraceae bacterium]
MDDRPIGVFDSGVGGLTVVKELRDLLPAEDIIYFGDTARVPYGNKSIPVIRRFSLEIARFLESMRVKMLVIACNTATALALDYLRRQTELPVVGVIEPGVRAAIGAVKNGRIGVIGTTATIRSEAYQSRLHRFRPEGVVLARPCPLLVPLVEENLLDAPITKMALDMYLSEWKETGIDGLILACTHYPLLKPHIEEYFGGRVTLIDSARETAREVAELLAARRIQASTDRVGAEEFYVSDSPEQFSTIGSAFLGRPLERVFLEAVWKREIGPVTPSE